jgi:hypothetical protein
MLKRFHALALGAGLASLTFVALVAFPALARTLITSQVTIASTATLVAPDRYAARSVVVTNLGTADVFCGGAGVTAGTGDIVVGVKGAGKIYEASGPVFCIVASGTQAVAVAEEF